VSARTHSNQLGKFCVIDSGKQQLVDFSPIVRLRNTNKIKLTTRKMSSKGCRAADWGTTRVRYRASYARCVLARVTSELAGASRTQHSNLATYRQVREQGKLSRLSRYSDWFDSTRAKYFSGAHPSSYRIRTRALFPEVKRPGREAQSLLPSSVEVKNGGAIPPLSHVFKALFALFFDLEYGGDMFLRNVG
jgi:hypothetical protein